MAGRLAARQIGEGFRSDDRSWLARAANGMKEILPALWEQVQPQLRRFVAAMGAGGEAEDILQDVHLTALTKAPQIAGREDLRRWLYRITANRCRLEHRRRQRSGKAFARLWERIAARPQPAEPSEKLARNEQREAVRAALEGLEPDLKTPLVLRYFLEMNSVEIGSILRVPEATVRSRLRAGRMKLAAKLARLEYGDE